MAFSSLFVLLDDIAAVLDDVALMSKIAAKKTAGVVGDDLALNAHQASGVRAERELPVVWAVAKGSLINKLVLIPFTLMLAAFMPMLIVPLLMVGGAYLCFEGVEKLWHSFFHSRVVSSDAAEPERTDEKAKIAGAVRTDFILSAEIIIIALGQMQGAPLLVQALSLSLVGLGITVLVYGLVAMIVKADDVGLYLLRGGSRMGTTLGRAILGFMPWFMRALSVVGTIAVFLVGGSIFTHYVPYLHHGLHGLHWDTGVMAVVADFVVGMVIGCVACVVVLPVLNVWAAKKQRL